MTERDTRIEPGTQSRSVLVVLLRPVVIVPALILAMSVAAPLVYRSMQFAGIPPIEPIVDPEVDGRVVIPEAENAFTFYRRAVSLLPPVPDTMKLSVGVEAIEIGRGWDAVPQDARDYLDSSQAALAEWKKGTELDDAHYMDVADFDYSTLLPVIQELRNFTRLATLQVLRCLDEGEADEAWSWLRAAFRSSRHAGMHGVAIERLVGTAIHNMTSRGIVHWAAQGDVTIEQLRNALNDIQQVDLLTTLTSETLKAEAILASNTLNNLNDLQDLPIGFVKSKALLEGYLFVKAEPQISRELMRHMFANYLSQCDKQPLDRVKGTTVTKLYRPTGKEVPPLMDPDRLDEAILNSIFARMFAPGISHYTTNCDVEHSRQDALELSLLVEMHRRKHGDYPDTLAAMAPEFMTDVPADWMGTLPTDTMLMVRSTVQITSTVSDEPELDQSVLRPCLTIYGRGRDGSDGGGDLDHGNDVGLRILLPLTEIHQ